MNDSILLLAKIVFYKKKNESAGSIYANTFVYFLFTKSMKQ
ncbi:MAG: hypothetical protein ACI976_002773 [Aureispira sp.]|jgi:hypothetical protein